MPPDQTLLIPPAARASDGTVTAAVVNSRRHRTLIPHEPWVLETVRVVDQLVALSVPIRFSFGVLSHDVAAWRIWQRGGRGIVHAVTGLPSWQRRYGWLIDAPHVRWEWLPPAPRQLAGVARDAAIISQADVVCAVRGRLGGNMVRLCQEKLFAGGIVRICAFDGEWDRAWAPLLECGAAIVEMGPARSNSDLPKIVESESSPVPLRWQNVPVNKYLFHFTRQCPGPWPGQDLPAYFSSIAAGAAGSGHTAFDSLRRILGERRIRGAGRLIRGTVPAVCLTAASPEVILKLVRWQPHLIRWRFQPYAIGFDRLYAQNKGAEPVIYGPARLVTALSADRQFLFQPSGADQPDWSIEQEWRVKGDIDFSDASPDEIMVLAPTIDEAAAMIGEFGVAAAVLTQKTGE